MISSILLVIMRLKKSIVYGIHKFYLLAFIVLNVDNSNNIEPRLLRFSVAILDMRFSIYPLSLVICHLIISRFSYFYSSCYNFSLITVCNIKSLL